MKNNQELEDFVNGLVSPVKIAESDYDALSLQELEALVGIDLSTDDEKVAYLNAACGPDGSNASWLDQFAGTPLHAKAVALAEQDLALEQERLQRRLERDQENQEDQEAWTRQDMLRLQKDMLMLELHKSQMGQGGGKDPVMQPQIQADPEPASTKKAVSEAWVRKMVRSGGKKAPAQRLTRFIDRSWKAEAELPRTLRGFKAKNKRGIARGEAALSLIDKTSSLLDAVKKASVQTTGQVNNGDPKNPELPRAALGVDSAGRRATPEEEKAQQQTGMDVQFRRPETGSKAASLVEAVKVAGDLSQAQRDDLSKKQFALPSKKKYPIPDAAHARNALARAAQFASKSEQSTIRRAVDKKFPGLDLTSASKPASPTVGLHHDPEKKASPFVRPLR